MNRRRRDDAQPPRDEARDLEALREVLVGPQRDRLDELAERVDSQGVTPEALADLLPAAVILSNDRDERLGHALSGTVDSALHDSVRRDPKSIADALFPVLLPAIRKAIASALTGVVETFNRALEDSVSVTGLKWRYEAWKTKRPYHEVVLSHTLLYRVRQVFLTHRRTGIMLDHCQDPTIAVRDPDLVSVMLRAIEDFVSDSFGKEAGDDEPAALPVREVKFDDEDTLVVAPGPYGVVAAVVEGRITPAFETRLQETVEQVHAELGGKLRRFEDDTAPFVQARPLLEACLREERKERPPSKIRWVTTVLLVALAALAVYATWTYVSNEREYADVRDELLEAVDGADGWSLQSITRVDAAELAAFAGPDDASDAWSGARLPDDGAHVGGFVVRALRDPAADAFDDVVPRGAQGSLGVAWRLTPHLSLEPWLVARRLEDDWRVPDGVTLDVQGARIDLRGEAGYAWLAFAAAQPSRVGGVEIDRSGLRERGATELAEAAADVERLDVFCGGAGDLPAIGGQLHLAATLQRLVDAAERSERIVEVVVEGRDVAEGMRWLERAEYARAAFGDLVASDALRWAVARGRPLGEDGATDPRCVELRVRILDEISPLSWSNRR